MIYRSGTAKELVNGTHSCPLERSKRLRHKEGCADGNLAFSVSLILWDLIIPLCNLLSQMSNLFLIFLCLCRQSQHKIQFYLIPATFKGFSCAFNDDLFGQSFIDHITQSLGSCFRCKGQAALSDILYFVHNIQRKGINSQRRQGYIYSSLSAFIDQKIYQFRKL